MARKLLRNFTPSMKTRFVCAKIKPCTSTVKFCRWSVVSTRQLSTDLFLTEFVKIWIELCARSNSLDRFRFDQMLEQQDETLAPNLWKLLKLVSCWFSAADLPKSFDDDKAMGHSLCLAAWHIENFVGVVVVTPAPCWWIKWNWNSRSMVPITSLTMEFLLKFWSRRNIYFSESVSEKDSSHFLMLASKICCTERACQRPRPVFVGTLRVLKTSAIFQ